jgi:cytochrome b6-f complex iron-sulfur subunit
MADPKKMSVKEILAACRKEDGRGESAEATAGPAATVSEEPGEVAAVSPSTSPASAPAAGRPLADTKADAKGKKPGAMSVAEILAATRAEKRAGGGERGVANPTEQAEPAPNAKSRSEMSVSEMMAAARAEKTGTVPPGKVDSVGRGSQPASKASPKAPLAKPAAGLKDTSSILAAARKGTRPGPISKAEAAAVARPVIPTKQPAVKVRAPAMPAKPEYAKPKRLETDHARRGFLSVFFGSFLAVGFTSLTLTNLLWGLGLARFFFPNILIEPPSKFKVGFPGDFAPGSVETKFTAQFGVWLTNTEYEGQQQIVALKTVCTHLGCTPNWLEAEQKFKCPCHGSGFYKDGINFEGPAPRPLERYAIRLADDGQLEVDKSRIFQQEMGQWSDPASFVPV